MNEASPLISIECSELFSAFKAGELKGPNAVAYDAKHWIERSSRISDSTARDIDLLVAALYFGLEFESIRSFIKDNLPRLSLADAVDFVVAGLNIQTNTVMSQTKIKIQTSSPLRYRIYG